MRMVVRADRHAHHPRRGLAAAQREDVGPEARPVREQHAARDRQQHQRAQQREAPLAGHEPVGLLERLEEGVVDGDRVEGQEVGRRPAPGTSPPASR